MVELVLLGLLLAVILSVVTYFGFIIHNKQMHYCKPFRHHWNVTHVSDRIGGNGELYRCENCKKVYTR